MTIRLANLRFTVCILQFLLLSTTPSVWARSVETAAAPVTAIDILLEPDTTMMNAAEAANARLRKSYPEGFALDATHVPHVTLLQRYVRTTDLDRVFEAVRKALAGEKPAAWKLRAVGYAFTPWGGPELASITVEPTEDLLRVQRKLIDAVVPFTEIEGTAAAFFTTGEEPGIEPAIIYYVGAFVPGRISGRFVPHVTVGLASPDERKKMHDEKFEAFTFTAAGVAVYQIGHFGTARKKLQGLE